jgi:hypothetical protein
MYNCKDYMIFNFPFDYHKCKYISKLKQLGSELCDSMLNNAELKVQHYSTTGNRNQLLFKPSLSKPIIDRIDMILGKHFDLSDEQLDYIINYDIKYRVGREINEE